MPRILKRRASDSDENTDTKRRYNTRSREKPQSECNSFSQSAKEKLDLLALIRSRKANKNLSEENKSTFNKWSLLSSDEEEPKDKELISEKIEDQNSSVSSHEMSDFISDGSDSSSNSSLRNKKNKKLKYKKKSKHSSPETDSSEAEDKSPKQTIPKKNKQKSSLSNDESYDSNSENGSSDESEIDELHKNNSKRRNKEKAVNPSAFVLEASSHVKTSKVDASVEHNNNNHKSEPFDILHKKDKHKSESNGPMHFTTHETVTADPQLMSTNIAPDILKKCKDYMKNVREDLKAIDKLKNEKDMLSKISRYLLNIGNHINHILIQYKDPDLIKEWRGHMWSFVSQYSKFDSIRLLKMYKNLMRLKESEEDKAMHTRNERNNDFSGWSSNIYNKR